VAGRARGRRTSWSLEVGCKWHTMGGLDLSPFLPWQRPVVPATNTHGGRPRIETTTNDCVTSTLRGEGSRAGAGCRIPASESLRKGQGEEVATPRDSKNHPPTRLSGCPGSAQQWTRTAPPPSTGLHMMHVNTGRGMRMSKQSCSVRDGHQGSPGHNTAPWQSLPHVGATTPWVTPRPQKVLPGDGAHPARSPWSMALQQGGQGG